jgi:hypothetical protein
VQLVKPDAMLELAKVIVLREQDITGREHDVARRRQELALKERELEARKAELQQLRFDFAAVASGQKVLSPPLAPSSTAIEPRRPSLARASATVAQRVLVVLEMEPRAMSAQEIFDVLELPPPIDTLRTTLWKMEKHRLIARPFPGHYCALQHVGAIGASTVTG